MRECTVVVHTHNLVRWTTQLFACLAQQRGVRYEIVVVDKGSTDETVSFVQSHTPGQLLGKAQGHNPPSSVRLRRVEDEANLVNALVVHVRQDLLLGPDYLATYESSLEVPTVAWPSVYVKAGDRGFLWPNSPDAIVNNLGHLRGADAIFCVPELFSIILPVYNRPNSLNDAVRSVMAQTIQDWHLYVIDDGSDIEVARSNVSWLSDPRISVIRLVKQSGQSLARNAGLEACRGSYVAFLDSDDVWYPSHLEQHLSTHEDVTARRPAMIYSDPDFAWSRWNGQRYDYLVDKHPTIKYWGPFDRDRLQEGNYIQTSSVTIDGPTARALRFPAGVPVEEDWTYFKSVPEPVVHLPVKTCCYHIAEEGGPEAANQMRRILMFPAHEFKRDAVTVEWALRLDMASRVGVVIPTRNRPKELRMALDSVRFSDVPVAVIDDASTDAYEIKEIVSQRVNYALLRTEQRQGAGWCRNQGVEYLVNNEWIQFLDDDDQLMMDWHQRLTYAIDGSPEADVIVGACWRYCPQRRGLKIDDQIYTSQICVRREAFLRIGGFEAGVEWMEERGLLKALERNGCKVVTLISPIVLRPAYGGTGDRRTASSDDEPAEQQGGIF